MFTLASPAEQLNRIERDSTLPPVDIMDAYLQGYLQTRGFNPNETKALGAAACDILFTYSTQGLPISDEDIDYLFEASIIEQTIS